MIIAGVDRYRVWDPMFEGMRVILSHHGEAYTPACIQGLSGAAFRIAGICPCAPTCSCAMEPQDLAALLGYAVDYHPFMADSAEARLARLTAALPRMDAELAAGRPFLLWNALTMAEWDVVAGHEGDRFLGRGSYLGLDGYAAEDFRRAADDSMAPALGAMFLDQRASPAPEALRQAEVASLREAVRHAYDTTAGDIQATDWVMLQGLAAYDRWVSEPGLQPRPFMPAFVGDRYCVNVYRSTHRAAAAYLREIAPHHPAASARLLAAAGRFAAEADALDVAQPLICAAFPAGVDAEQRASITAALSHARDAYAAGIGEIAATLAAL